MLRGFILGVSGLIGLLLAAELALRLLPVSTATHTGYYIDPLILNYPARHRWQDSTGWDLRNSHALVANNLGFLADVDFVPNSAAIGLIGDSYVEASMLDPEQRPAAQLQAMQRSHRQVYALGGPGSALLDYAERIRFASERLGLRDFVVLIESGDLRQTVCGSGNVHGACLDPATLEPKNETRPGPSLSKRVLRHSALAQYLVGQLKVDFGRLPAQAFAGASHDVAASKPAPAASSAAMAVVQSSKDAAVVRAATERFFVRVQPYLKGRLVFVVDGRRDPSPASAQIMLDRDTFIALARQQGSVVIDAEPLYRRHEARSGLSLSVSPQDRHLNALGVGLLMRAAAQELP